MDADAVIWSWQIASRSSAQICDICGQL